MTLQILIPSNPFNHNEFSAENLRNSEPRRQVYFYEGIQGYIICEGENRKSNNITLYTGIITQDSDGGGHNNSKFNGTGNDTSIQLDQSHVVSQNDNTTIWQFRLPTIQPPSKRVSNPCLLLSCQLSQTVESGEEKSSTTESDIVLPDYKPNLQEWDHTTSSKNSRDIQADQATNVIEPTSDSKCLKTELCIPIAMALVIKMKSTKPAGRNGMLLVALTIERSEEMAAASKGNSDTLIFDIRSVELNSDSVAAAPINELFPMRMGFDDSVNVVYKLDSNESLGREPSKQVSITTCLTIQKLHDGCYTDMSNLIQTNWKPHLDLGLIAPPINNALKTNNNTSHLQSQISNLTNGTSIRSRAMLNNVYKVDSPSFSNLSPNPNGFYGKRAKSFVTRESSSVSVNLSTNVNSSLAGLKLTFIGRLDMKQGVVTKWKMQAINNSANRLNLSLLVQNPINFNPIYSNTAPNNNFSSSNLLTNNNTQNNQEVIIYNKAQLFSLYNTLKVDTEVNGVIILNNDIRIGPLEPSNSFETSLDLIGNTKGIFSLDGLKIFDVATGDGLDFGKLIEVFVV